MIITAELDGSISNLSEFAIFGGNFRLVYIQIFSSGIFNVERSITPLLFQKPR